MLAQLYKSLGKFFLNYLNLKKYNVITRKQYRNNDNNEII